MNSDFKKVISKELKNARNDKDLTLENAYKISTIAPSTISSYENNTRQMSVDVILKLLESYEIEPIIFFGRCIAKTQEQKNEISYRETIEG